MLKILKARLQQHVNQELLERVRKGRDQNVNIRWIIEKVKETPPLTPPSVCHKKTKNKNKNINFRLID